MTIRKTLFVTAAVMALVTPVMAAGPPIDGNTWVEQCRNKVGTWQWVACVAYARGIADGLMFWHYAEPENTSLTCIDPKVTAQQLADVGVDYIKANPKTRAEDVSGLLALAFRDAWPCNTGEKS